MIPIVLCLKYNISNVTCDLNKQVILEKEPKKNQSDFTRLFLNKHLAGNCAKNTIVTIAYI